MSDLCKCGHAEDHHFTPRLGGRCFRHECECVAFEAPNADRDDLAAILRGHQRLSAGWFGGFWCARCSCGKDIKAPDADDRQGWDGHREHLAQVVAESDWLRGVRAKELRDAAEAMEAPTDSVCDWGHKTEDDCNGECSTVDYVTPMVSAKWLRDRADRVDAEDTDNTTDRT